MPRWSRLRTLPKGRNMKRIVIALLALLAAPLEAQQYVRPDGASSFGDLCDAVHTGTFADIDETVPSNADYVYCESAFIGDFDFALVQFTGSNVTDPVSSSGHVLRWRCDPGIGEGVVIYLMEGVNTTRASASGNCDGNTQTYTLSAAEANAITDYSNLEFRGTESCDITGGCGGSGALVKIFWIELEVPSAGGGGPTRRVIVVQ